MTDDRGRIIVIEFSALEIVAKHELLAVKPYTWHELRRWVFEWTEDPVVGLEAINKIMLLERNRSC